MDNLSNNKNNSNGPEELHNTYNTPLLFASQSSTNYLSHESSTELNDDHTTSTTTTPNNTYNSNMSPANYRDLVQPSARPRSNTISSIMSGYQIVKEHMDKKKFIILLFLSLTIYLGFLTLFAPRTSLSRDLRRWHSSKFTTAEAYRIFLNNLQEEHLIERHIINLTRSSNASTYDQYLIDTLKSMGFSPHIESYYPWISQPIDTQVRLIQNDKVIWEATLVEDIVTNKTQLNTLKGFNSFAPSGNVTSQFVYCNYGTLNDYKFLVDNNIDIEGKIHIIKYGHLNSGLKVKNAELYGASSVIFFNDPVDDGAVTIKNGYLPFPDGPARNPSAIERGTVEYYTDFPGDPTTPNYPSKYPYTERLSPVGKLPRIPSIPLSVKDITPILQQLNHTGIQWRENGNIQNFDYSSGPSINQTFIQLFNKQNTSIVKISNIIVQIPGIFQHGETIIGAHRDSTSSIISATTASNNAILLEIARGFKSLLDEGWKPLRPIKLIIWDGEDNGLVGSTEFIDDHGYNLRNSVLAYLNLDNNVITGSSFTCKSNPLLHYIIKYASKFINFKGLDDVTLFDEWKNNSNGKFKLLDGTSDYVPFQYHLAIPSASFSFERNSSKNDPVAMTHSLYDDMSFVTEYIDPNFELHSNMASMVGLIALMLGENELHMFKTHDYFKMIYAEYKALYRQIFKMFPNDMQIHKLVVSLEREIFALAWRYSSIFDRKNYEIYMQCKQDYPIWSFMTKLKIYIKLLRTNDKLKQLDTMFLSKTGLSERPWFKHTLFAPNKNTGIDGVLLPGIHDSIAELDRENLLEWINTLLLQINNARSIMH